MFKQITFFALTLASFAGTQAVDTHHQIRGIIVPGINGRVSDSFKQCVPFLEASSCIFNIETPSEESGDRDLGQQKCIDLLNKDWNKHFDGNKKDLKCIFAGTSQGTATILNWLGQQSHAEQEEKVAAIFLESVLGSGNSGIMHTVDNMIAAGATYLPLSRIWMPLAAKAQKFPHYKPWGMQAIKSASNLSPNIPVIIIHHVDDKQTCIDNARHVYCELKNKGNNNVYLFEIEGTNGVDIHGNSRNNDQVRHIDVLDFAENKDEIINAIQTIFEKHGMSVVDKKLDLTIDLLPYQPTVAEVEQRIATNSGRKNFIRNIIDCTTGAALVAGISYLKLKTI